MDFRECGGIDLLTALLRSYPIDSGVDLLGTYFKAFVLYVDEMFTVEGSEVM